MPHSRLPLLVLSLIALLFTSGMPATAQDCSDDPDNVLNGNNCDFDTDAGVSGWSGPKLLVSHNTTDSCPNGTSPGILNLTMTIPSIFAKGPCLDSADFGNENVTFGASFKPPAGSSQCSVGYNLFPDNACEGNITAIITALSPNITSSCGVASNSTFVNSSIGAVMPQVSCNGSKTILLDNLFIQLPSQPMSLELEDFRIH